ncbi:MAG: hypothetical protein ABII12_18840 [Planctomycetota bacterium]
MSIEFHCEHCNQVIKAPAEVAGQTGTCPHCKGATYIPRPRDDDEGGELALAPLDEDEERRAQQAAKEAAALQRRLLKEQATPGETKPMRRDAHPPVAPKPKLDPKPKSSSKQLNGMIVSYIEAMSTGRLDRAEELVRALSRHAPDVSRILDAMETDDLSAYGLPPLPRPVLSGFVKQLRMKL